MKKLAAVVLAALVASAAAPAYAQGRMETKDDKMPMKKGTTKKNSMGKKDPMMKKEPMMKNDGMMKK